MRPAICGGDRRLEPLERRSDHRAISASSGEPTATRMCRTAAVSCASGSPLSPTTATPRVAVPAATALPPILDSDGQGGDEPGTRRSRVPVRPTDVSPASAHWGTRAAVVGDPQGIGGPPIAGVGDRTGDDVRRQWSAMGSSRRPEPTITAASHDQFHQRIHSEGCADISTNASAPHFGAAPPHGRNAPCCGGFHTSSG